MLRGIMIPYYIFATATLTNYPPDVPVSTTNAARTAAVAGGYVKPWGGAAVQGEIATLVSLATTYPNVPIVLVVNGGADGAYWHDAGSTFDPDFHSAMVALRTAGVKIIGYIDPTVYTISMASSKEKVDRWYAMYGDVLDGIFVDDYAALYGGTWPLFGNVATSETPDVEAGDGGNRLSPAYYDELNAYIRVKRNPSAASIVPLVLGNINQLTDVGYYTAGQAPDTWLVVETFMPTPSQLAAFPCPPSKRWIMTSGYASGAVSDALLDSLYSEIGYMYFHELNAFTQPTYEYLSNWVTRQVQYLSGKNAPTTVRRRIAGKRLRGKTVRTIN